MGENGLDLSTPVQFLKGVGPARAGLLESLGIETVEDLIHHYPRRLEDRSRFRAIAALESGETATVRGQVVDVVFRRIRPRLSLVTVILSDGSDVLDLLYFNQPYRRRQFRIADEIVATGRVERKRGLAMVGPEAERIPSDEGEELLHTGRIVPVHPLTKGITAGVMRRMVHTALFLALEEVRDPLPSAIRVRHDLVPLRDALRAIHFPDSAEDGERAARRLRYDELFFLQLALALRRSLRDREAAGHAFEVGPRLNERIRARLPFELTKAQERAVAEVVQDMRSAVPMARLLQGDVGSGKTAVALYAILVAVANRRQAAIMAPTEILAEQHFRTFSRYLHGSRVRIELLLGAVRAKPRREILSGLADGSVDVVVGTHALIQRDVAYRDLALVVVDEQHRFGVLQRAVLKRKGTRPDMLFMTATPIPRTLTLAWYGDLDQSVIDEMPPGRKPVRTRFFPESQCSRAYELIRGELARGRQAFFVFPLVTESEEMPLKAATEEVERLRRVIFPGVPVGLVHGQMKRREKEEAMRRFRAGEDRILAATTVVEVGIDVPNATVMVIEHAERYGLSQLHQLRGRIGRGRDQATLVLIGEPRTEEARERLRIMCRIRDGFRIAAEDLRLRGPGEVLGTRQHGLPDLRLADPARDADLLDAAHRDAFKLVSRDPGLTTEEGRRLREALKQRYRGRLGLSRV